MSEPKIQGTMESCIARVREYCTSTRKNYNVYFDGKYSCCIVGGDSTDEYRSIYFFYNFGYREYDNSS